MNYKPGELVTNVAGHPKIYTVLVQHEQDNVYMRKFGVDENGYSLYERIEEEKGKYNLLDSDGETVWENIQPTNIKLHKP